MARDIINEEGMGFETVEDKGEDFCNINIRGAYPRDVRHCSYYYYLCKQEYASAQVSLRAEPFSEYDLRPRFVQIEVRSVRRMSLCNDTYSDTHDML